MPLEPGTRLGPYEVIGAIGAGGMGEVYRARDTRLDRIVAIKVLPELFASDSERLNRFEREAKTLASLNHANVAQIFGIVELPPEGGSHSAGIAMEFVDGEDLSQRLERGAIPLDETLLIARQIADALEAAHDQGIIHRDLKPANVKVRADGTVKVLDFGLAKAVEGDRYVASDRRELANSPTFTTPAMTQMGMILGTAAYMSPEQARGRAVDRRADIWAFGCLLYEMLTGRRPFGGDDISLTLAAVLKEDVDFTALPAETPTSIRRLLRRCLQKDPRKRLSAIADARLELDEAATDPRDTVIATTVQRSGWRAPLMWAAAGALLTIAIVAGVLTLRPAPVRDAAVVRSQILFADTPLSLTGTRAFVINPAGTEIIFAGQKSGEAARLFRRRLGDDVATAIAGAEGAFGPFFSSDGQWLGFVQNARLKKMPAGGGGAIDLGDVAGMQGGAFTADGGLIFNQQHGEGLLRIAGSGTERKPITTVAHEKGEAGHHWPHLLPGGTHLLFTTEIDGKPYSDARIELLTVETGERRVLIEGGSDARYMAATGHIVYWRQGDLWSVPFDLSRLQLAGSAVNVVRGVMLTEPNGVAQFTVSDGGTLVYLPGGDPNEERGIALIDRLGAARPLTTERRAFEAVSVSPDGRRLALTTIAANDSLWTMEIGRSSLTRITYEAENARAVWSPDGSRIALTRHTGGEPQQLYIMPSDGATTPVRLRESTRVERAESWTPNGNRLAFTRSEESGSDIWVAEMDDPRKARPFVSTRYDEIDPRFSPDGKWIAYSSNESGRFEVYVRPFPGPGQKRAVSTDGGDEPHWRADGRELFYRLRAAILVVDIMLAADVTVSAPRVLFRDQYKLEQSQQGWDVLPDGKTFVMVQDFSKPRTALTLVQNWFEELKKK